MFRTYNKRAIFDDNMLDTSRGQSYLSFKSHFIIEPYLLRLKPMHTMFITKLRLFNIKFPIETERWRNIPRANRPCSKCTSGMIVFF
jgi:hypothetical protein